MSEQLLLSQYTKTYIALCKCMNCIVVCITTFKQAENLIYETSKLRALDHHKYLSDKINMHVQCIAIQVTATQEEIDIKNRFVAIN